MKYLKSFNESKENLRIIKTDLDEKSYASDFIKGEHQYYLIEVDGSEVGSIEYGEVDKETIEIISIHIEKQYRSNNYGLEALNLLLKKTNSKRVILKSAPSSRRYWKKLGYEKVKGRNDYFEKYF